MKREMLRQELEKALAEKALLCAGLKKLSSQFDCKNALNNPELDPETGDRVIKVFTEIYRHTNDSDTLTALLLGLWGDMEELVKLESLRKKLRFLDMDKFPEIYFAYTLLISGETDPEVFGCITNPLVILGQILSKDTLFYSGKVKEADPKITFRKALQETVKEMIREKYKRHHRYEL